MLLIDTDRASCPHKNHLTYPDEDLKLKQILFICSRKIIFLKICLSLTFLCIELYYIIGPFLLGEFIINNVR